MFACSHLSVSCFYQRSYFFNQILCYLLASNPKDPFYISHVWLWWAGKMHIPRWPMRGLEKSHRHSTTDRSCRKHNHGTLRNLRVQSNVWHVHNTENEQKTKSGCEKHYAAQNVSSAWGWSCSVSLAVFQRYPLSITVAERFVGFTLLRWGNKKVRNSGTKSERLKRTENSADCDVNADA